MVGPRSLRAQDQFVTDLVARFEPTAIRIVDRRTKPSHGYRAEWLQLVMAEEFRKLPVRP